jgi:protein phosphatase
MKAFGLTDTGKERDKNQDSILLNHELQLYIVADGMGGHVLGEVASIMAVKGINDYLQEGLTSELKDSADQGQFIKDMLRIAVMRTNSEIINYSRSLPNKDVIGTTVSLALFNNGNLYIAHVGDSRIYRVRKRVMEKLTKDHTKAQELVEANLLAEDAAENHKSSHTLTKAVGARDIVSPDINAYEVKTGDRFLISSDGLFRVLDVEVVRVILASSMAIEDKCKMLIDKTLEGGAPDNVSVVIIEAEDKGFIGRIFSRR